VKRLICLTEYSDKLSSATLHKSCARAEDPAALFDFRFGWRKVALARLIVHPHDDFIPGVSIFFFLNSQRLL
jgi:hypothetical protein